MIIAPTPVTAGPTVPDSSIPEPAFDTQYEAFNTWEKTHLVPEINALADNVYHNAQEAEASAIAADADAASAAGSASAANTSAGSAATAATNAQNSFLANDKKYLGAFAANPTTDNQGAALAVGATYWNTVSNAMRAYTGSAWVAATPVPTVASGVAVTPTGRISATDVQSALVALDARESAWVKKSANGYTAAMNDRLTYDTSGGALSVSLPAAPVADVPVTISDYARTFGTNNLTVLRNGKPIEGLAEDYVCDLTGETRTFTYIDATKGWKVN